MCRNQNEQNGNRIIEEKVEDRMCIKYTPGIFLALAIIANGIFVLKDKGERNGHIKPTVPPS